MIVVETESGRDADRMPLLVREENGRRSAPVFSSMRLATAFLSRAQELGHLVKLDYIFPLDRGDLAVDFPNQEFQLDPSPEAFFS